ncbi:signal peptidase I [uncultured Paludibaculum sp.]|uniref:signal peptidase I n=1 Tax=uncultured Paludibaculum sp. TaxID=1765020 RepID=UPI002AAC0F92|nr:signal peptidase I [uncultured Paludibaculum sp.]
MPLTQSKTIRRSLLLVGAAMAVLFLATPFVARAFVVPTESMASTLLVGDHLFVGVHSAQPVHGSLITFRSPADPRQTFIKRVVGLPGDRIRLINKVLYRNGEAVNEGYAEHRIQYVDQFRDNFPSATNLELPESGRQMLAEHRVGDEIVIPAGHYFVLGDNRDNSLDSRYFGFVPQAALQGEPLFIYWSKDPKNGTRWARTFRAVR